MKINIVWYMFLLTGKFIADSVKRHAGKWEACIHIQDVIQRRIGHDSSTRGACRQTTSQPPTLGRLHWQLRARQAMQDQLLPQTECR